MLFDDAVCDVRFICTPDPVGHLGLSICSDGSVEILQDAVPDEEVAVHSHTITSE